MKKLTSSFLSKLHKITHSFPGPKDPNIVAYSTALDIDTEKLYGAMVNDRLNGKYYSFDWLVSEAKKKFGWKNLTQNRMKKFVQFVYYLGRKGVKPPYRFWAELGLIEKKKERD